MQSVSFTKLFSTITDSSLWDQPDWVVKIWITMLAMANGHGIINSSIPGLANRSRKTIAEVEQALAIFRAPDPYSRTKLMDGRRIVDIEGGWQLVTYEKHRNALQIESNRESKRASAARARARAKEEDETVESGRSPSNDVSTVEETSNLPSSSSSGSGSGDPEGVQGEPFDGVTVVDPKKGRFAPKDFTPTDAHRVRCQELKLPVDELLRDFKLHEFNRDYSDWDRRFSRWIEQQRLMGETERAKAQSSAASGPRSSFAGGRDQRGPLVLEPDERHRRFAAKHGLDLDALMYDIHRRGLVEALGLGRAREIIGEQLTKLAREKATKGKVA